MTASDVRNLLEEQPCHISPRSDFKRRILRLFWKALPQQQDE